MRTSPTQKPLSFDEFKHLLANLLQVDESAVTPEASFVTDLQVDSIKLVELMIGLDESGINIPMEAAWDVQTVGDAYRVYRENAEGTASQASQGEELSPSSS
jgi:acyl carrier protein